MIVKRPSLCDTPQSDTDHWHRSTAWTHDAKEAQGASPVAMLHMTDDVQPAKLEEQIKAVDILLQDHEWKSPKWFPGGTRSSRSPRSEPKGYDGSSVTRWWRPPWCGS